MCEECGKNPANVHLTQISPEGTVVAHLCEECARAKGIAVTIGQPPPQAEVKAPEADVACPRCGLTYSAFREKGRLGCAECYRAFGEQIDRMLSQMHGSCVHKGKVYQRPAAAHGTRQDISRLRGELERAIRNEDFEEAAKLRDTISALSAPD
jgi:protein arginine kinase activator